MENVSGAPEGFTQAVKELEDGIEKWAEVQQGIWKVWFDTMRQASPAPQTPGEALMENWQDMVKRTISLQEQWLSTLSSPQTDTAKSSPKASTKASGSSGASTTKK